MLGELALKTLHGDSAVRTQSPGANFQLTEHSLYGSAPGRDDNQFVALTALRRTDLTHAQYRALPKEQRALYAPIRERINHPNIRGPLDTGWGPTDFDPQLKDIRIGVPSLPGQVTN